MTTSRDLKINCMTRLDYRLINPPSMMASQAIKIQNKKHVNTGWILNSAAADCPVKIHDMTKTTEKINKAVEHAYLKDSSIFHATDAVVDIDELVMVKGIIVVFVLFCCPLPFSFFYFEIRTKLCGKFCEKERDVLYTTYNK